MKKSIKKIISLVASTCLVVSLCSFYVSANETETQVQGMGAGSIDDIVSNVASDVSTIETLTTTLNEVTDSTTLLNSETTSIADSTISLNSETTSKVNNTTLETTTSLDSIETTTTDDITTIITTFETTLEETTTSALQQVSNSKNIILDLDISGSMSGTPLDAMKEAAIEFCTKMLNVDPNAKIAIVAFGSTSEVGVQYTSDLDTLIEYIDGLSLMGATNMFESFEDVKILLETGDGDSKNVIIMADGMPNSSPSDYDHTGSYGYSANATLNYDNANLKPLATIYTIGYFHNLSDSEKDDAEPFMKDLASDSTLYYNADVDSINIVFNQIANDIIVKDETITTTSNSNNNVTIGNSSSITNNTTTQAKTDSPQTSDVGISSIAMVSVLTGIVLLVSKKNK